MSVGNGSSMKLVDPLLTAKELAPLLGLTGKHAECTVNKWKQDGRIPAAIDEGPKAVRYDLAEVLAALKKRAEAKQNER